MKNDVYREWIAIAKNDLKAAKILYESGEFRMSYYCFQQSSEKASKAMALRIGLVKPEELKKEIGHDATKVYEKIVEQLYEGLAAVPDLLNRFNATEHLLAEELKKGEWQNKTKDFLENLKKLRKKQLTHITTKELNQYLDIIYDLEEEVTALLWQPPEDMLDIIDQLQPWLQQLHLNIFESLNHMSREKKIKLVRQLIKLIGEMLFVGVSLYCCAVMTMNHNHTTRYPLKNMTPLKLYSGRFPAVRKQREFMLLLEESMSTLEKISRKLRDW